MNLSQKNCLYVHHCLTRERRGGDARMTFLLCHHVSLLNAFSSGKVFFVLYPSGQGEKSGGLFVETRSPIEIF